MTSDARGTRRSDWAIQEATRILARMAGKKRPRHLPQILSRYPIIWMFPSLLLLQMIPVPVELAALRSPGRAASVLGTTLTVVGTVQALAMAVIVFAAQAFSSSRYGSYGASLTDFAHHAGLTYALNFGVAALLVGGVALLGVGPAVVEGWAGTWSMIVSASFVIALPVVFWRFLAAIDPNRLREWRLDRIRQLGLDAAWDNSVAHLAEELVEQECDHFGVERELKLWIPIPDQEVVVRATADGQVGDINLKTIERLAALAASRGATAKLYTVLKASVRKDEALASTDAAVGEGSEGLGELVKIIGPERNQALELLDGIHAEALDAVRSGQPSWYSSVAEAYVEFTLGPARRVAQYGLPPDTAFGVRTAIFARTPLERVSQYLYEELVEAVTARGREVAFDAIYLPRSIAQEAAALGASSLLAEVSRLYPWVYDSLTGRPEAPLRELMADRSWRHLIAIIEYPIEMELRETSDSVRLSSLVQLASTVDSRVVELLRSAITARDRPIFNNALEAWLDTLRTWDPDHAQPYQWDVENMRKTQGDTPEVIAVEAQARINQLAAHQKASLVSDRNVWLFGLMMWALRAARPEPNEEVAGMFLSLDERLGRQDDFLTTAGRALGGLDYQWFSSWIMLEAPNRRIHVGGAEAELLAAFVAALLVRASRGQITALPPLEWLPHRLSYSHALVDELASEGDLMSVLRIDDPDETSRAAHDLIEASAQSAIQREDEQQRQLSVPDESRRSLLLHTERAWNESRFISRLFEVVGTMEPADTTDDLLTWTARTSVHKMFLQIDREDDLADFGSNLGHRLSRGEINALLAVLDAGPSVSTANADPRVAVVGVINEMQDNQHNPTVVLLPADWRLHERLGLDWRPEGHPPPPNEFGLGTDVVAQYLGTLEGIPAFYASEVDKGSVYVVDVSSLGSWQSPADMPGQTVEVVVTEFDAENLRTAGRSETEILELLKSADVRANEQFTIEVESQGAGRVIHILDDPSAEEQPDKT